MILHSVRSFESHPSCYSVIHALRDDDLALAELKKKIIFDLFFNRNSDENFGSWERFGTQPNANMVNFLLLQEARYHRRFPRKREKAGNDCP